MAVYASLEYLNIKDACIRCQIDSAIPEKRGMGSSAAISIAAIRAVFDYYQAELPHDVLEILVNRAEMIAHMNPSGLDAKTCLSDQPIRFIKNLTCIFLNQSTIESNSIFVIMAVCSKLFKEEIHSLSERVLR